MVYQVIGSTGGAGQAGSVVGGPAGDGGAVVVDALPYIDHEYDGPGVREAVLAMVEEETRRYRPTKNYLEHLPSLNLHAFETDIMRAELERLQSRTPMDMISMKRYELPPPVHGRHNDLQAWTEAVENSYAQLEQQVTRIINLELLEKYGAEVCKAHNEVLVGLARHVQGRLRDMRAQIQDIHLGRKTEQTEVGERLQLLESQWVGLVSKNYEIERACAELEKEMVASEHQEDSAVEGWTSESVRDDKMDISSNGDKHQDNKGAYEKSEEPPTKKIRGPE
ncbi:pre-mRNA-splicing factor SPF27-like [Varroa jacobsoni]|uniref:Pre-mRNA-splicing factor SPF27 n=1 Tax=Varroa destructor TaxID=109461 RepID=A0A7M7K2E7_VARDE|nr:pre-mRNA-splicing factor SPF27-like [Varroa destructor]XP_022710617.1 pre-mRNA-splicing factor SPF27-like [Varroa jacobsoni]